MPHPSNQADSNRLISLGRQARPGGLRRGIFREQGGHHTDQQNHGGQQERLTEGGPSIPGDQTHLEDCADGSSTHH